MNNLQTNIYNTQNNLRTISSYNATKSSDYIVDDNGNIYEVVDKNDNGSLDKDAFLKILLTQMQLQDPLNPMDSNESISQMTSFSILEQLTEITSKIDSLGEILFKINETLSGEAESESNDDDVKLDNSNNNSDTSKSLLSKLKMIYS